MAVGGGNWRAFYFLCYFFPVCSYKTSAIVSVERDDFLKGCYFFGTWVCPGAWRMNIT